MDGLLLILFSWFIVSLICYIFILRYNRRRQSIVVFKERINGNEKQGRTIKLIILILSIFMQDVANWLVWGNGEKKTTINTQFNCLITKSLNEASNRLKEQGQPEVHFDSVQINQGSASSALKNFHVRPNRSPGNHLSISGSICIENNRDQPKINLFVSLYEQQKEETIRKTSKIESATVRSYEIIIEEINGEVEVRLAQIAGELFIIACFSGRPNVCLKILEPTAEKAMEDFVVEFTRKCILGSVLNFSLGELLYPDEESIARASKARLSAEYRNLSFLQEPQRFPLEGIEISSYEHLKQEHFLHIHLMELRELKDGLLNLTTNERPFVCIELNEPSSERFLSPKGHLDAHSGNYWFWHDGEANFELAISPTGGELLFELFTETPSYSNEKNNDLPPTAIYATIRQRRFLGMAILKISDLRRIVARQPIGAPVQLILKGKGTEQNEEKSKKLIEQKHGIILFQSSFHQRTLPLLKLNNPINKLSKEQLFNKKDEQNSFYFQNNQQPNFNQNPQKSPTRSTSIKKGSIPSLGSLKKPRNQPHYIYNVTEDRLPFNDNTIIEKTKQLQQQLENEKFNNNYNIRSTISPTSDEESFKPKQSFDTINTYNSPERQIKEREEEEEKHIYSTINNTSQIRKTISDSNALLFKYEQNGINRKQSAPGTPQMAKRNEEEIKEFIINGVNNNENTQQSQPDLSENQKQISKELKDQLNNANDEYDHLFNGMNATATAATHPAMEIFRLPAEKEININDTADELRRKAKDRERQSRGRKERRNFFEQIRARPLKLFPGRHNQRAKSLDDYEQHLEEAAISAPQSRDQSQQRKASSGGFHEEEHNRQQRLINSAGPSSMATSTTNLISSRQQNILSKGNSQSQLILELIGSEEEGPTYYAIPAEISNEPAVVKLMQSGKKLHIQNSHILVAVKAQGRVICSVCNKRIGGNFSSRQAYQCRDCRIVCHKNCHQQIDWICENISSLSNLHVEEVDWVEFLRHHHLREFISVGNL